MATGKDLRHMMLDGLASKIDEAHRAAIKDHPTEQVVLVLDLTDPIAVDFAKACGMSDTEIEGHLTPSIGTDKSAIICLSLTLVNLVDVIALRYPQVADRLATGRPFGAYAIVGISDGGVTIRDAYPMKLKAD